MTPVNLTTAKTLFQEKKFSAAFDQFCSLAEKMENPAFNSFMAGKCQEETGNLSDAHDFYQKAIAFDDSNALINREIEHFIVKNNYLSTDQKCVFHYFPNTTNIGDSGAAAGIRALLNSLTDNLFFYTLSCRNDTDARIRQIPINASGMLIGGGGLFFQQPSASGWYFPLSEQELAALSLPAITYAIGFNQEYSDEHTWEINEPFRQRAAKFHQHFTLKSVRDIWSKNILENEGISDVNLIPCPSAFLEPLSWYTLPVTTSKKIIGLSITDRSLAQGIKSNVITTILDFAWWLQQHDFFPLFILHDTGDDLPLVKLISENQFSCIVPNTAREAITLYDRCFCVVGMRGHSLILSAGRCVPFIGISYNKKIDAFMETFNLREYCLNQNDITQRIILINAFEKLLMQRESVQTHLKNKREIFYSDNRAFCTKAIAIMEKTK